MCFSEIGCDSLGRKHAQTTHKQQRQEVVSTTANVPYHTRAACAIATSSFWRTLCVGLLLQDLWGHEQYEYVITSLLENVVSWKIKRGGPPSVGIPSSTLIHGHALCLSGRRPSSAVHHFGS